MLRIDTAAPEETEGIGRDLGELLVAGDCIALAGELGTGKTTFVRGIARGMGLDPGEVASPSFTMLNVYEGPFPLFHIDLYRLSTSEELFSIDFEEYIKGDGVVVIEWADRIPEAIPEDALWVTISYSDAGRTIVLSAKEDRPRQVIAELKEKVYT